MPIYIKLTLVVNACTIYTILQQIIANMALVAHSYTIKQTE